MDKSVNYAKKHCFKVSLFHFFDINLCCSFETRIFINSNFLINFLNHFNHER